MDRSVIFMQAVIKDSFDRYSTLIEDTEEAYRQAANEAVPYTEAEMASMLTDERAKAMEWYAEDYYKFTKGSSQPFFRNALLTGYYSLMEHYTFKICTSSRKRET